MIQRLLQRCNKQGDWEIFFLVSSQLREWFYLSVALSLVRIVECEKGLTILGGLRTTTKVYNEHFQFKEIS